MKRKYQIGCFLLGLFGICLLYISGIMALFSMFVTLCVYGMIVYVVIFLYKKIFGKEREKFFPFFIKFLGSAGLSLGIVLTIVGSFCYYQNDISPAKMPIYEISNGKKFVTFQSMSHIGTRNFYGEVQESIRLKKEEGYVLFFEGVKPGSEENAEKFNQIMGLQFDDELYKNFSKLYGVVHQDNDELLGIVNDNDFNVDIGIDTIIEIYEKRFPEKSYETKKILNVGKEITKILSEIGEKELKVLVYVNQAIINTIIKYDKLRDGILSISGNNDIFNVILDDRNSFLVNEIAKSEHDKIIITYGLMHFSGVLEELQKIDPKWKINSQSYLYPIK